MSTRTLEEELEDLTATRPALIKRSYHPQLPLAIYNYTEAAQWRKYWNPTTIMARGLVLERGTSKIIARPMPKFFNHSEGLHTTPDTDAFTVLQKVDGSLGVWFHYEGRWYMATRGSFNSPQAIQGQNLAVRAGLPEKCDPTKTYCFEILYPENHLVVDYKSTRELILLAVIDTSSGHDASNSELPGIAVSLGVTSAMLFNVGDDDLEQLAKTDRPNEEGFVIRFNTTGERIKMKFATYINMTRSGLSGGASNKAYGSSNAVTNLVIDILTKNPGDSIENHLDSIPDEFFDDARSSQQRYHVIHANKMADFDQAIKQYTNVPFKDIEPTIPRHDLICKHLRKTMREGANESDLRDVREEYAAFLTAKEMGHKPAKGRTKPGVRSR